MMKKFQFKTNINCENCLAKIGPFLDQQNEISEWEVDLAHDDRVLSIESESLSAEDVQQLVSKTGFVAEAL
ncbi:MAG: hypothetical protein MI810_10790 [Flavobacteriales bacterium]|nr:hypothetical protein [Flavobacteriales bacterium]